MRKRSSCRRHCCERKGVFGVVSNCGNRAYISASRNRQSARVSRAHAGNLVLTSTPGRHTGNIISRNELLPQLNMSSHMMSGLENEWQRGITYVFPSPSDRAWPTRSRRVPRACSPTRPLSIQSWTRSCCSPGHALWRDLPISVVSRPPEGPSPGPVLGPERVSPILIFYPSNEHGPLLSLDVHTGGASRRWLMPANRQCGV